MRCTIENQHADTQREDIEYTDKSFDVCIFRYPAGKSKDEGAQYGKANRKNIFHHPFVTKKKGASDADAINCASERSTKTIPLSRM